MSCPGTGPCAVWDLDLSCCLTPSGAFPDPCLLEGQPVPQSIIDNAKLAASQLLWAITGRTFGCCSITVRPCRKKCVEVCCIPGITDLGYPWMPVHQADGSWINVTCPCPDECSCVSLCEILLPDPICSIDQVKIDGAIVDPSTYRVDDFRKLVRLSNADPASGCWPECNDLTKSDSEIGTWSVSLTYGREIPALVRLAAEEMACELIKNCMGGPCRLPQRVSSVTRQGISVSFLDDMQFLSQGLTGLYLVDLAARTYNPHRLARRPNVSSPDSLNKWRVETWKNGDPISGCT